VRQDKSFSSAGQYLARSIGLDKRTKNGIFIFSLEKMMPFSFLAKTEHILAVVVPEILPFRLEG